MHPAVTLRCAVRKPVIGIALFIHLCLASPPSLRDYIILSSLCCFFPHISIVQYLLNSSSILYPEFFTLYDYTSANVYIFWLVFLFSYFIVCLAKIVRITWEWNFIHLQYVMPNLYDALSSMEDETRYFEEIQITLDPIDLGSNILFHRRKQIIHVWSNILRIIFVTLTIHNSTLFSGK